MIRRLVNWFLKNVLSSEKNIPELMFLAAMVSLGTADDVERTGEVLDETKADDKALKESLTNWHNLLMAGMVIASVFFGGYLVVDTLGTTNKNFLPHILGFAWLMTGLLLTLALIAEVFINRNARATPLKE